MISIRKKRDLEYKWRKPALSSAHNWVLLVFELHKRLEENLRLTAGVHREQTQKWKPASDKHWKKWRKSCLSFTATHIQPAHKNGSDTSNAACAVSLSIYISTLEQPHQCSEMTSQAAIFFSMQ